jgi:hypothetical protein
MTNRKLMSIRTVATLSTNIMFINAYQRWNVLNVNQQRQTANRNHKRQNL